MRQLRCSPQTRPPKRNGFEPETEACQDYFPSPPAPWNRIIRRKIHQFCKKKKNRVREGNRKNGKVKWPLMSLLYSWLCRKKNRQFNTFQGKSKTLLSFTRGEARGLPTAPAWSSARQIPGALICLPPLFGPNLLLNLAITTITGRGWVLLCRGISGLRISLHSRRCLGKWYIVLGVFISQRSRLCSAWLRLEEFKRSG